MSLEKSLSVLLDVPGVDGAFVVDELGVLLARDESFALPPAVLASAAARIATLIEAAAEGFESPKEITLTFASHRLVLRALSPCVLAVLARPGTSAEALRMASNITLRHMVRQLGGGGEPSVSALQRAPAVASAPSGVPSSARMPVAAAAPRKPAVPAPLPAGAPNRAPPPKKKPKNDIWG